MVIAVKVMNNSSWNGKLTYMKMGFFLKFIDKCNINLTKKKKIFPKFNRKSVEKKVAWQGMAAYSS